MDNRRLSGASISFVMVIFVLGLPGCSSSSDSKSSSSHFGSILLSTLPAAIAGVRVPSTYGPTPPVYFPTPSTYTPSSTSSEPDARREARIERQERLAEAREKRKEEQEKKRAELRTVNHCVAIVYNKRWNKEGTQEFINTCPTSVSISWCTHGGGTYSCQGIGDGKASWTLKPGTSISTGAGNSRYEPTFAACETGLPQVKSGVGSCS